MLHHKRLIIVTLALLALIVPVSITTAQGPTPRGGRAPSMSAGTAFTYQGQLKSNGTPVNATCDFQFSLFDAASAGEQIGDTQTIPGVSVNNGLFTTPIDFGHFDMGQGAFSGDARYLQIAVACPSPASVFTPMTTRQELTPAPYALGLVPGATIKGSDHAGLVINNSNGYGLVVSAAGRLFGTAIEVSSAEGDGVHVGSAGNDGVSANGGAGNSGVSGLNLYANSIGTKGVADAPGSVGVWGESSSNTGVYGKTTDGRGVWGESTGKGWAGYFSGRVVVTRLGAAGSTSLCRNTSGEIATCSSSLRYKENIADLDRGLDAVAMLRPVTFNWKDSGQADLGFVAEEVHQVTPLLTTLNQDGQVEGVKYDRVSAVLVKAVQEQQQQIETLKMTNAALETRLGALEQSLQANNGGVHSDSRGNFTLLVIGALVGIVIVQKPWQRGSR